MYNLNINFSCISKRDKSSAQGFILMIVSLASLLSPIIFANIIDSTCLVWTNEHCGQRGSCQLYDQALFRYKFNGVAVGKYKEPLFISSSIKYDPILVFSTIAVVLDYFVWHYGKEMKIYGDENYENQGEELSKTVDTII